MSALMDFQQYFLTDGLVSFLAGISIPAEKQKTFLATSYYQILVKDNNIIKSTQKPAGDAGPLSWPSMTQKENEESLGCAEI